MTHHEDDLQQVTIEPSTFQIMEAGAERAFGKPVEELSFGEASQLVGIIAKGFTQRGVGRVSYEGRTVIDSEADGGDALRGFGDRAARELAPRIDDERELVINVRRNKTLWDSIRRRDPKIEQTLRFRDEPPQYV